MKASLYECLMRAVPGSLHRLFVVRGEGVGLLCCQLGLFEEKWAHYGGIWTGSGMYTAIMRPTSSQLPMSLAGCICPQIELLTHIQYPSTWHPPSLFSPTKRNPVTILALNRVVSQPFDLFQSSSGEIEKRIMGPQEIQEDISKYNAMCAIEECRRVLLGSLKSYKHSLIFLLIK